MIVDIALLIFTLATLIQVWLWGIGFRNLDNYQIVKTDVASSAPLSVVICARNEEANLRANLALWLNQEYPAFELIIVDDDSSDGTAALIAEVQKTLPQLKYLKVDRAPGSLPGKKHALAQGIRFAQNDILVLTDADCSPASSNWLQEIADGFTENTQLVLAFAPFYLAPGLLNRWIRYEGLYTAWLYLSAALWKEPYMGVGRNLAYRKELFDKAGGFGKHADLSGGDDDLFVNGLFGDSGVAPVSTSIVISPQSWALSEGKHTWSAYLRQKKRHLSTGIRYHWRHQLILGLIALSHFLHLTLGFLGLWYFPIWAIAGLCGRLLIFWFRASRLSGRFGGKNLRLLLPVLDLFFPVFYLFFSPVIFGLRAIKKW
ncbi:MAG: glycosyltransferase [Saprospiraceae bacterium]|nr:glycosyltransferase [Saprospiraceae bacterium]